ncbi:MAG TPA: hypothetical protein PLJ38_08985, partial [bacterium]|nr:hypothetical protein [bacterium]
MYKNLILKLFVFFLLFAFTNSKIISNAAELLIFHNSNCENCVIIKELHLMPLLKNYNFQYIDFDITEKRNYELLLKVEKYFGDTDNPDLPVVIFNNNIYSGKTEILNNLRNALDNSQNSNGKPEDIEKLIIKLDKLNYAINNDAKKINIIYFYKSGCNDCARINKDLEFLNKQNTNLQIFKYNIADSYSINLYEFLSEKYNIPNTLRFITPAVFIADKFLINDNLTIHEIQKILSEPNIVNIEISEFDNYQKNPNLKIFERFKNFKILPIVLAGLIDGINPCAFAVIIFFVSYLFILKKSSNTIILAGLSFIAGIYIVYLLIGAGFLEIIFKFKLFAYINNIIYYFFVSILLLFGLINLYDFLIVYKTGKTQNMIGQLSLPQKLKIHNFIKRSQKSKAI